MDKQVLFEDEFPDGPNGKKVNLYENVVGKYLIRVWCGNETIRPSYNVFQSLKVRNNSIKCNEDMWPNIALFDLAEIYKCDHEVVRSPLT